MMTSLKQIKLAIVGCGAVAQTRYLPAVDLIPNLTVTHVVDNDVERAREAADRFQIPNFVRDCREVFGKVDAVVVATPPRSHAQICIDCLSQGLHVLCEKPLATSAEEVQGMIAASQQTHTHLAVGMNRRLSWSAQLLKHLVQSGMLGDIYRFDVEEGGEFNWPLRTGHIFQDGNAGGVITDAGSHVLDLSLWILGSQRARLVRCRDDNWGGGEANAILELTVEWSSGPVSGQRVSGRWVSGRVELSFTRTLRNTLRIHGESGCLEAPTRGGLEVIFYPKGEDVDPVVMKWPNARPRQKVEDFAIQLSNFTDSIVGPSEKYVSAHEVLTSISLIEQCHRSRKFMAQPWEIKHLESFFEGKSNE
jgi:predicted dehydrogenase